MFLVMGMFAIIATFLNLYLYKIGKEYKLAMAMGLSFTSLTLVAEHSMIYEWVKVKDWAALLDVVPTMTTALWVLTMISILLNIIPILLELRNKK